MKFTPEIIAEIEKCINRGNTVEIKKSAGQIQIVELSRKLKIKTSAIG